MNSFYTAIIICTIIGFITSFFAKQRGKNPLIWFFLGSTFGIFGLLLLFILPKKKVIAIAENNLTSLNAEPSIPLDDSSFLNFNPLRLPTKPNLDWYFINKESLEAIGPLTIKELREAIHKEKLLECTYVWCEEFNKNEWKQINEFSNKEFLMDPDLI